jgi:hypothetical protein
VRPFLKFGPNWVNLDRVDHIQVERDGDGNETAVVFHFGHNHSLKVHNKKLVPGVLEWLHGLIATETRLTEDEIV